MLRWGQLTECRLKSVHMCFPRSPAVIVVRGAWSSAPAASPEEQTQWAAGKSAHATEHEQHEAWAHSQVSAGEGGEGGVISHFLLYSAKTKIFDELIRSSLSLGSSLKCIAYDTSKPNTQISLSFGWFEGAANWEEELWSHTEHCVLIPPWQWSQESLFFLHWGSWGHAVLLRGKDWTHHPFRAKNKLLSKNNSSLPLHWTLASPREDLPCSLN